MPRAPRTMKQLSSTDTSVTIESAIAEYFNSLRRKGSAPRYVEHVETFLGDRAKRPGVLWKPFLRWAHDRDCRQVGKLSRDVVLAWLDEVQARTTPGNYHKAAVLMRRWLRFVVAEGFLPTVPLQVVIPKTRKAEIAVFTLDEIHAMSKVASKENVRDWAIFMLLVDTGLRASEVTSIKVTNIHWDREEIVVLGKGSKFRTVPLTASLGPLQRYRNVRGDSVSETPYFFLSFTPGGSPVYSGGTGKAKRRQIDTFRLSLAPLTRVGLFQLVKKWGTLAKITSARCSPHTFRHFFAVQYLRNGGDILTLQKILGHSKIDTTLVYAKLANTDVKRFHKSYSPALNVIPQRQRGLDVA